MKYVVSSALALCCGMAMAAEPQWLEITKSNDGNVVSMDINSVKVDGTMVTVWFKTVFTKPGKAALDKRRVKADCRAERLATLSFWIYDAKGHLTSSKATVDSYDQWVDVAPETVGRSMLDAACAMAPEK